MNEQDLARLMATLEHLKHPFDRKQIGQIPGSNGRPAVDFVNHAHVTNRLNQYAPDWAYTVDEMFTQNGECWIRGTMTIYGASRVEFGKGKNPLEAMSHFIRRAAMRFGVATDLWAKEDFEDPSGPFDTPTPDVATGSEPSRPVAERAEGESSHAPAGAAPSAHRPESGDGLSGHDPEGGVGAEGGEDLASTPPDGIHIHAWSKTLPDGKTTRPGWVVCDECGTGERENKVTVLTAPVGEDEERLDLK